MLEVRTLYRKKCDPFYAEKLHYISGTSKWRTKTFAYKW